MAGNSEPSKHTSSLSCRKGFYYALLALSACATFAISQELMSAIAGIKFNEAVERHYTGIRPDDCDDSEAPPKEFALRMGSDLHLLSMLPSAGFALFMLYFLHRLTAKTIKDQGGLCTDYYLNLGWAYFILNAVLTTPLLAAAWVPLFYFLANGKLGGLPENYGLSTADAIACSITDGNEPSLQIRAEAVDSEYPQESSTINFIKEAPLKLAFVLCSVISTGLFCLLYFVGQRKLQKDSGDMGSPTNAPHTQTSREVERGEASCPHIDQPGLDEPYSSLAYTR